MTALQRLLWMACLACLWSPSFLFIKLAVTEIPPMMVVAMRVSIAALLLVLLMAFKKRVLPKSKTFWLHSAVMAIFSSALPFSLFCYAETTIESALAAILNGTSPMFTALLVFFFMPSDKLTVQKMAGVMLSVVGLLVLFYPNIEHTMPVEGSTMGMLAGLGASLCYSISHLYAKRFLTKNPPLVSPAAQLICSSLYLWPLVFLFESPLSLPMPSLLAISGVLGLAVFGTFIAFIIYYKVLEESGPTALSTIACIFPVVATFLGYFFLGETLDFIGIAAAIMIFAGLFLVNEMVPFPSKKSEKAPA